MEEYTSYLSDNADEREREAASRVMEGLWELRLEARMQAVRAERAELRRRQRLGYLVGLLIIALLAGLLWRFGFRQLAQTPALPERLQHSPAPSGPDAPVPSIEATPAPMPAPQTPQPIARALPADRLPAPRHQAPPIAMLRSGNAPTDEARQSLLDQLWYVEYPLQGLDIRRIFPDADRALRSRDFTGAYMALNRLLADAPDSDTLRYLSAYCLMELGEADEAEVFFKALKHPLQTWAPQLAWYRGLNYLQGNRADDALDTFRAIAQQANHPYQLHSQKALQLLGKR